MNPTQASLAGSWQLQHFVYRWPDGREQAPLGRARGWLHYLPAPEARMSVQVAAETRPPLDPDSDACLAALFRSGFAYTGHWRLEESVVHHDVEIATLPVWEGITLSRCVTLTDDTLTLATDEPNPQLPEGGYETLLIWRRA
ncbi:lipocalin-like domain-containing protein [Halomonas sp. WWR20]